MKLYTAEKESVYWNLALSSFIPGICSILILSVVFLPLLIGAARENDASHEKNILFSVDSFLEMLNTNAKDITNQIEKSEWIHDVYINQIINEQPFPYEIKKKILSDLTLLLTKSGYVSHICVRYYGNSNILFTNKGIFDNLEHYQENFPEKMYYFFFPGKTTSGFTSVDFNGVSYLVYSAPITDIEGGRAKGEINIVFEMDRLKKQLHLIGEEKVSCVRILGVNGETDWEYKLSEEKRTVTLSDNTGLKIQTDIPGRVHIQNQRKILPYIILTIMIDLAACAFLTYLFSKKNYRPVEMILKKFEMDDLGKNEFETLSYMFDQILMEKSEAEVFVERLTPLARQKVINSLLDNPAFFGTAHVEEQLKDCKIEFPYSRINVAVIHIPFSRLKTKETKNLNQAAELAIQTIVEQMCGELELVYYLCQEDIDRYKMIVNYNREEVLQVFLERMAERGNQYIHNEKIADSVYIGTGSEVKSRTEIHYASEQADMVINYCIINHVTGIVSYSEIRTRIGLNYSYSLSDEILLTHAIIEGNRETAEKVLEKIICEVSKNHQHQSVVSLRLLFSNLLFTVLRSAENIGVSIEVDMSVAKWEKYPATLSAIEETVKDRIGEICRQVEKIRRDLVICEEDEILKYIDQHIFDSDLSLNYVADRYHKSAAYISMLFKNKRNMNYTDYVNRARINRAVELLTDGHMDIDAVYRQVGYISVSTFRRNFVKYMKHNPGEFVNLRE